MQIGVLVAIAISFSLPGFSGGGGGGSVNCTPPVPGPLNGLTPARMPSDYLTTEGQVGDNMLMRCDSPDFNKTTGNQGVALTPEQCLTARNQERLGQEPRNAAASVSSSSGTGTTASTNSSGTNNANGI